ncbi:hypothetical protein K450DRAFT_267117 [Umbelopsis ramanniana AG]|uniref:Uncharacterized protein n=1 Tax=Umbelopsis ramanniana AG TaxID=1314678 RepID=A0AAD5EJ94_UMBRA|nr:uncharacterized protein K450DRAFT_267117 [Umbelopsis ramanniana AG]KAI8584437.1 hypothetical protein K450DRAFT_267117 [Umbelopsis ramanniana AG]
MRRKSDELQQGNAKAAKPQQLWSEDKSDDDYDDEDEGGKGGKGGHNGNECATRSVSILIGSSTFDIPCLGAGSIVNLNGLLPSFVSTSSVDTSTSIQASSSSSSASTYSATEWTDSSSVATSSQPGGTSESETETMTEAATTTTNTDIPTPTVPCTPNLEGDLVCAQSGVLPYFYTCDAGQWIIRTCGEEGVCETISDNAVSCFL